MGLTRWQRWRLELEWWAHERAPELIVLSWCVWLGLAAVFISTHPGYNRIGLACLVGLLSVVVRALLP